MMSEGGRVFGLGFTEILFISILALILIGPKQLPEVARTLGRLFNEFRRSTNILTEELKAQTYIDQNQIRNDIQRAMESRPATTEVSSSPAEQKSAADGEAEGAEKS